MNTLREQEKTAIQVLSSRVHALEKSLAGCREAGRRLSSMLIDYMNEEANKQTPYIRVPKNLRKKNGNSPHQVQARYDIMRILAYNGMSDQDIENEFGINSGAVYYARKHKWKAKHLKENK